MFWCRKIHFNLFFFHITHHIIHNHETNRRRPVLQCQQKSARSLAHPTVGKHGCVPPGSMKFHAVCLRGTACEWILLVGGARRAAEWHKRSASLFTTMRRIVGGRCAAISSPSAPMEYFDAYLKQDGLSMPLAVGPTYQYHRFAPRAYLGMMSRRHRSVERANCLCCDVSPLALFVPPGARD